MWVAKAGVIHPLTIVSLCFTTQPLPEHIEEHDPASNTIGAMDMGGASLQIAFLAEEGAPTDFVETLELFGKLYNVYARSYLCYGADETDRRLLASLVEVKVFLHSSEIIPYCTLLPSIDLIQNISCRNVCMHRF